MRLDTLLNWIKRRRLAELLAFFVAMLILCQTKAMAVEQPQVTITTDATSYAQSQFFVDVTVVFFDEALYNEQVYLSYHILDSDGEMLAFENQRLPMSLDEDGCAWMTVAIDAVAMPETANGPVARIQFDLVDEQNFYWFLDNTAISFQAAQIECDSSLLTPPPAVQDTPETSVVSVALNCMVWVVLAILLFRYVRKAKGVRGANASVGKTH